VSKLYRLKNSNSLHDIAKLLGYRPSNLSYILYCIPENKKYNPFNISKKNGGKREINAPIAKLKKVQRKLAELLDQCAEELLPEEENIKKTRKRAARAVAHGFKKGLSC